MTGIKFQGLSKSKLKHKQLGLACHEQLWAADSMLFASPPGWSSLARDREFVSPVKCDETTKILADRITL